MLLVVYEARCHLHAVQPTLIPKVLPDVLVVHRRISFLHRLSAEVLPSIVKLLHCSEAPVPLDYRSSQSSTEPLVCRSLRFGGGWSRS